MRKFSYLLTRILFLQYQLRNFFLFKKLSFTAFIHPSVKIEGKKFVSINDKTTIKRGGWILSMKIDENVPDLLIDKNCDIGDYAHITCVRRLVIERNVLIANKVYISDNTHKYEDILIPIKDQNILFKGDVIIKEGAWIGENVCIIGCSIGKNSIVGANSVVLKDVPDYSVVSGNPAKIIKRYSKETNTWIKEVY
ncbi:acyltransferase [Sphingobacterium spiritivorum]|uniref:acyltransferase n=1 Tax=Sphingobacterium spiritivorum TaxID=258 RepID=UPI003DA3479B